MTSWGSTSADTARKLLIKPSKAAVRRIRETAPHRAALPAREQRPGGDQTAQPDHSRAGPPTTGHRSPARRSRRWTHYLWRLTYKWAKVSHSNKPTPWVFARYFGKFNKARQDRWVFGDRTSGAYLHRFAWTNIVRHQIVRHGASPDDPDTRRLLGLATAQSAPADQPHHPLAPPRAGRSLRDLQEHPGRRRGPATNPAASGRHGWPPLARRSTSSGTQARRTRLDHPVSSTSAATPPASHQGLLEPDARKRARPVLRGARRRKAPGLPDASIVPIAGTGRLVRHASARRAGRSRAWQRKRRATGGTDDSG